MSTFLNLYNHDLLKIAVLGNAHNIVETEKINTIGTLSFDLPITDQKTAMIEPYMYVRYGEDGELYRVLTPRRKRGVTGIHSYECEHVLATLIDDVIFGFKQYGGMGVNTRGVIEYILGLQTVKRWVLDVCEPDSYYEYGWDSENLLSMLFSVANFFPNPIMWQCDTKVYPWRVSLKWIRRTQNPQLYIRAGKNMLASELEADYTNICTRLYLLGYGEGVNQLTVEHVNGGKPYIDSYKHYGNAPISRILVDRRFEDEESLLDYGRTMLQSLQEPHLQMTVDAADLYGLTGADYDKAELGRIVRLTEDDTKTYIVGITRNHDKPGDMQLTLANQPADIASAVADLADRQRIESVYAQGATQIYAQSVQANATPAVGAEIHFYIPSDMRIINWVKAKIKIDKFRTYANTTKDGEINIKSTEAGGGTVNTDRNDTEEGGQLESTTADGGGVVNTDTSSGGNTVDTRIKSGGGGTQTSSSGGGTYGTNTGSGGGINTSLSAESKTAASYNWNFQANLGYGGGQNVTVSSADGSKGSHSHSFMMPGHTHNVNLEHKHDVTIPGHSHSVNVAAHSHGITISDHTHTVNIPAHEHTVDLPSHSHKLTLRDHKHQVKIPAHRHKLNIKDHKHEIKIPAHKHELEHGIFTHGNPKVGFVYVTGKQGPVDVAGKSEELDITGYLLDDTMKIPRGRWLTVKVVPDDLAYITIDLVIKGFCQSRGDHTY